jgi:hypothetical protein
MTLVLPKLLTVSSVSLTVLTDAVWIFTPPTSTSRRWDPSASWVMEEVEVTWPGVLESSLLINTSMWVEYSL